MKKSILILLSIAILGCSFDAYVSPEEEGLTKISYSVESDGEIQGLLSYYSTSTRTSLLDEAWARTVYNGGTARISYDSYNGQPVTITVLINGEEYSETGTRVMIVRGPE